MDIRIKHYEGKYPSFNVSLASNPQAEEFLTIKGCRIVAGKNGDFISWPATKNGDKYWSHVWANEAFAAAILKKAQESKPRVSRAEAASVADDIDELPF